MNFTIITGTSRGLGESFFKILSSKSGYLISISRRFSEEQYIIQKSNKKVYFIHKDLSEINMPVDELQKILDKVSLKMVSEVVFINNAAVIDPIGKVGSFTENQIYNSLMVNMYASFSISNFLVKLQKINNFNLKILNISSGAAKRSLNGWAMYCSCKSGTNMFFNVLKQENNNTLVYNIDPGVIDTDMQKKIRETDETNFPDVTKFKKLKENNKLQHPDNVAIKIINEYKLC